VLNLHLVPGFIGGIVAVISAAVTGDTLFNLDVSRVFPSRGELLRSASTQAGFQLAAIIVTISIAIASAVIAGIILNLFTEFPKAPFDDGEYWIVPQHSADEGSKDDGDAMTDVNASQVELVVVEKDRL
jgi:ammonium transporter Rh